MMFLKKKMKKSGRVAVRFCSAAAGGWGATGTSFSASSFGASLVGVSLAGVLVLGGCATSRGVDRSVRPNAADGAIVFDQQQYRDGGRGSSGYSDHNNNNRNAGVGGGGSGGAGSAWSAVLGGGYVGGPADYSGYSLNWRNDDQVVGQPRSGPILATHQWPQPERPSVRTRTRVQFPRNADTLLFFGRPSERRGGDWGWWGG